MGNSYGVIPLDEQKTAKDSIAWMHDSVILFVPEKYPHGRLPTRIELDNALRSLGYELEAQDTQDVSSKQDFKEIIDGLVRNPSRKPDIVSFRYGGIHLLDIIQELASACGSFLIVDGSGGMQILVVPDSVIGVTLFDRSNNLDESGYVATIIRRMPYMIERLKNSASSDVRFLLSQIRQAIVCTYSEGTFRISQSAREGLSTYKQYLKHSDEIIRFLAYDLINLFQQDFYETMPNLQQAIVEEENEDYKVRKIWALEPRITSSTGIGCGLDSRTQSLINSLIAISSSQDEVLSVRLAAAHLVVRSQPGFYNEVIHNLFVNLLVNPAEFTPAHSTPQSRISETLKSIETMLLNHRMSILRAALPHIKFASDAHEVMRTLLDNVFFGESRDTWRSGLGTDKVAERPPIDEAVFREYDNRSWLYPSNPVSVSLNELQPHQIEILREVLAVEIPWMVHSNVLEKYGLSIARSSVLEMLSQNDDTKT